MEKGLILVDMLKDFIEEDGALSIPKVYDIIPNIKEKLRYARNNNELIVYLCDSHEEDDIEFNRFPPHCIKDTKGAEIISDLTPKEDNYNEFILPKQRYSGFYKTGLDDIINHRQIKEVEVVGVCTHICVMDTVGGFANRDIPTVIDKRAIADFDKDAQEAAIKRMYNIYGTSIHS